MERQLVVFKLADEEYGAPIEQVREIIRFVSITAVPKAPESVLGVISLRGRVIPVVSLRKRFGFSIVEPNEATRVVVSDVDGQTVGFVVDSVSEVLRLDEGNIEPPPEGGFQADSQFIKGIGKTGNRLIILLELARIMNLANITHLATNMEDGTNA